jgi:hypothetical protein
MQMTRLRTFWQEGKIEQKQNATLSAVNHKTINHFHIDTLLMLPWMPSTDI